MKQLLNTLFVTSEDIYLSLEGENVLANREKSVIARYPLHTLQSIVTFSYPGASPALMGACAEKGIGLAFCSPGDGFWLGSAARATEMCCCAGNNTGLPMTLCAAVPLPAP